MNGRASAILLAITLLCLAGANAAHTHDTLVSGKCGFCHSASFPALSVPFQSEQLNPPDNTGGINTSPGSRLLSGLVSSEASPRAPPPA